MPNNASPWWRLAAVSERVAAGASPPEDPHEAALLGTIAGGLHGALKDETRRDAALLTFLVTLSGVSLLGIGAAFWGVVAGAAALLLRPR